MECVLQWLDELDDLVSTVAMQSEALRRIALRVLGLAATLAGLATLILVARLDPAGAAAVAVLLSLMVLQRRAAPSHRQPAALRG